MHAVPTAAEEPAATQARPPLRARLDRPFLGGIIAMGAVTAELVARVLKRLDGNVSGLPLIGDVFAYRWELPRGVEVQGYLGHDGQFYYRMARNPANLAWSAYGIGFDAWYRLRPDGHPAPGLAGVGGRGPVTAGGCGG